MRVGFFNTCINWVPHFETDLELIDKHIQLGDETFWFNCNGELPFCQPNPKHQKKICQNCIKRKNKGLRLLEEKTNIVDWKKKPENQISIPQIGTIQELKEIYIKDLDIGLASVSSLVSVLRDSDPDMKAHYKIWSEAYKACFITYKGIIEAIKANNIEKVYLFNGRYAVERAVYRACLKLNIDCVIHDRGKDIRHYMLYPESLPHSRATFRKRMNELWEDTIIPIEEKKETGEKFYQERLQGKEQFWVSFVAGQKKGLLPDNWNADNNNITIFTSSEDELISISDEWKNPVYDNQFDGIQRIINDSPKDINFYLRIHPNLIGVKNQDIDKLMQLSFPNLTVIDPKSEVNSYDLIKNSNKVLTFGSSVGIEASYWGTPSILAGVGYYHDIGGTYDAKTHKEVIDLITCELEPKDKLPAIKYGYYFKTFGYPHKHYQALNLHVGKYKGKLLYGKPVVFFILYWLSKLKLIVRFKQLTKKYRRFISK